MSPEAAEAYFTRSDGTFRFARWGRPIAPFVFGTDDASLPVIKWAINETVALGDLGPVRRDPQLGANLLIFFVAEWDELLAIPGLGPVLGDVAALVARLEREGENQHRSFRLDGDGSIALCVVLLKMDAELSRTPAQVLVASQVLQVLLLWSDTAFPPGESPVGEVTDPGRIFNRPEIAALVRAAYDPRMPVSSDDPSLARRLAAGTRAMTLQ